MVTVLIPIAFFIIYVIALSVLLIDCILQYSHYSKSSSTLRLHKNILTGTSSYFR